VERDRAGEQEHSREYDADGEYQGSSSRESDQEVRYYDAEDQYQGSS
jgi:hypothetical protein